MSDRETDSFLNRGNSRVLDPSLEEDFWRREVGKFDKRWKLLFFTNAVAMLVHAAMGVIVVMEGFGAPHIYYEDLYVLRGLWLQNNPSSDNNGMNGTNGTNGTITGLEWPASATRLMSSASPGAAHWERVPLALPCATFAFLSAIAHAIVSYASFGGPPAYEQREGSRGGWYFESLARNFVWWRWVEYALSAPVMLFAMQTAAGIREINVLGLTFFSQSGVMLCGLLTELYSRICYECDDSKTKYKLKWTRRDWRERLIPFFVGCYLYVPAWVVFIASFYRNSGDNRDLTGRGAPDFVYGIIWGEFAVFSLFTFPIVIGQMHEDPSKYWMTEVAYSFLSLAAKVLLNSLLLANVFMVRRVLEADANA